MCSHLLLPFIAPAVVTLFCSLFNDGVICNFLFEFNFVYRYNALYIAVYNPTQLCLLALYRPRQSPLSIPEWVLHHRRHAQTSSIPLHQEPVDLLFPRVNLSYSPFSNVAEREPRKQKKNWLQAACLPLETPAFMKSTSSAFSHNKVFYLCVSRREPCFGRWRSATRKGE
jgi:hypothetical protein